MYVELLTPGNQLFAGEATQVKAPGINGGLELLNSHAPLITALEAGVIHIRDAENHIQDFAIKGGVLECSTNKVIILAD